MESDNTVLVIVDTDHTTVIKQYNMPSDDLAFPLVGQ